MIMEMTSEIERPISEALPAGLDPENDEQDDFVADDNRPNTTRSRMRLTPATLTHVRLARTPATAQRQRERETPEVLEFDEQQEVGGYQELPDDVMRPESELQLDGREDTNDSFLITELRNQDGGRLPEEEGSSWQHAYARDEEELVSGLRTKSATFIDDEEYDTDLDIEGKQWHFF